MGYRRRMTYEDGAVPQEIGLSAPLADPASTVPVPDDFKAIGYSGLFWMETPVRRDSGSPDEPDGSPESPDEIEAMAARAPFLARNPGWIVLAVDVEAASALLVRRDDSAVVEALTGKRPRPSDDVQTTGELL